MTTTLLLCALLLNGLALSRLEKQSAPDKQPPVALLGLVSASAAGVLSLAMLGFNTLLAATDLAALSLLLRTLLALGLWPLLLAGLSLLAPERQHDLKPYLALVTANGFALSLLPAPLPALLGFALLLPLYIALRARLRVCDAPAALRGLPLECVILSLLGLALAGLEGVWR